MPGGLLCVVDSIFNPCFSLVSYLGSSWFSFFSGGVAGAKHIVGSGLNFLQ